MNEKSEGRAYYSDEYKLRIIQKVLSGEISKEGALRKYGIKGHSAITNWMRSFGIHEPLNRRIYLEESKDSPEGRKLSERVKELEKELKLSELKAAAYSKMIDIAEEELSINIRKKLPTKQSGQ